MPFPSWIFGRKADPAPTEAPEPSKPKAPRPRVNAEMVDLVSSKTVAEVLSLVKRNKLTAQEALKAEKAGRGRVSLIAALERA